MTPGTSRWSDIFVFRCIALGRPPAGFLEPLGGAELIRNGLGTLGACGKGYEKTGTKNLPNKTAAQAIHAHTLRIPIQNSNPEFQSRIPIQNSNPKILDCLGRHKRAFIEFGADFAVL